MKNKYNPEPKIVCLGGGVGTVQLIKGLRHYTHQLTVVVSMADDGGSAGRLRRLYSVPPPGDLINCLAALSNAEPILTDLLTFRFKGNRWGRDDSLGGQKLGNLILVALTQITGDFSESLKQIQQIFSCHGVILPATNENLSIWAKTIEGQVVKGEQKIDLGQYKGKREISRVFLEPKKTTTPANVLQAILNADLVVTGPEDLYTTLLPVLLVNDIKRALRKTKAKKVLVVNIANKPFETPNYAVTDFLAAIRRHLEFLPFDQILVNNNFRPSMPRKVKYHYVPIDQHRLKEYNVRVIKADLVDQNYALYHDSTKLARKMIGLL